MVEISKKLLQNGGKFKKTIARWRKIEKAVANWRKFWKAVTKWQTIRKSRGKIVDILKKPLRNGDHKNHKATLQKLGGIGRNFENPLRLATKSIAKLLVFFIKESCGFIGKTKSLRTENENLFKKSIIMKSCENIVKCILKLQDRKVFKGWRSTILLKLF